MIGSEHRRAAGALLTVLLGALPMLAMAADAPPKIDSGDSAWMLTSTALVLLMTVPGLALFYAGMVRSKNALSVMMQCFAITCLVTILWALYGYSLAFYGGADAGAPLSDLRNWIGDLSHAFMAGITADPKAPSVYSGASTIPETVYSMFQLTFAIITPALIVGAFAER